MSSAPDRILRHHVLVAAVAAAIAGLPVATARAQQAPPPPDVAETATDLDVIIVTANKRAENVREVPVSISVVGEQQLENLAANQLSDYAAYVPGLYVTDSGTPGQTSISLRGIAPISPGANIGTYVDETPVGSSGFYQRQTAFALDLLPYDIAQVEVLRGPQGTLYGAGAMGGLLKYVTRDPDLSVYEFRAGAGLSEVENGNSHGWKARVGANLPLVQDVFGLRVSYAHNDLPGYIDNARSGRRSVNDGEQESARIAALWQPSEAVRIELTAMRQTIDSEDNATVSLDPVTEEPVYGDLSNGNFVREPFEKQIDYYAATLEWSLGWADFVSATSYSDTRTRQRADATIEFGDVPQLIGLPSGISYFDIGLDLEKVTQEFRLTSRGDGPWQWQVGAFYTEEEADNFQIIRLFDASGVPVAGFDPLAELELPSDYEETAVFANASYDFSQRFNLGTGVRFARNEQSFAQIVQPGSPIIAPGNTPGSSEEDVFTWHVAPKFQLTPDTMLYARLATGYQPGGPNVALPDVPSSVDSSRTTNYELGLKSQFADRRAQIDVALFRIDWEDIQVGAAAGGVTYLTNAGEAVSQGVELSSVFRPTERLQLGLNAAYTDAKLTQDGPLVAGFVTGRDGDRLPLIPEFAWSVTADYSFPLRSGWDARIGAGLRWVGDRESALTNTSPAAPLAADLDSYRALDLNADVGNGRWTFRAYLKNATDERAYANIGASQNQLTGATEHFTGTPILPRTFGVEVDYRF